MKEAFEKIKERLAGAESVKLYGSKNSGNYLLPLEDALSIVSEVEAEYGNGWIPCSERLPKNTDDVLVTTVYGLVIDAYLSVHKNWCFRNGTRITDLADMPIAWMPLPSPYKPTTD